MRIFPRTLSLVALLFLVGLQPSAADGQKRIEIENATPYSFVEFYLWPVSKQDSLQPAPYYDPIPRVELTGFIQPWSVVPAYVEETDCIFLFTAITNVGGFITSSIDACRGDVFTIKSVSKI